MAPPIAWTEIFVWARWRGPAYAAVTAFAVAFAVSLGVSLVVCFL